MFFFKEKESEFFQLKKIVAKLIQNFGRFPIQMLMSSPTIFKNLPWFKQHFDEVLLDFKTVFNFYEEHIREHKIQMNEDETANDFVSAFLAEKERKDKLGSPHNYR